MAKASKGPTRAISRPAAESDVYTVMVFVAFLFSLAALIYVGYRTMTLFGSLLPPPGS